ncbi:MAG: hypothetical protein JWO74_1244 [Solirubrobacterales bacterium]|jgi:hypothetical protein|nr:hypothetical protein [Solirubrobacterales bacterium]
MVFLGDLGRDIPQAEAQYWRSFNIPPPEEGASETLIRRAFGGQFADPQSLDLRFPGVYRRTNEAWQAAFGEPLFQPLHEDDRHVLSKLHVPVTDGAAGFDEQLLYLAKLLVASLNEEALTARLGKGSKGEKGLAKLERLLGQLGVHDARALLGPFAKCRHCEAEAPRTARVRPSTSRSRSASSGDRRASRSCSATPSQRSNRSARSRSGTWRVVKLGPAMLTGPWPSPCCSRRRVFPPRRRLPRRSHRSRLSRRSG